MLIQNAIFYDNTFLPRRGGLRTEGMTIAAIGDTLVPLPGEEVLDAEGLRLTPGFVDVHVHGGAGREISEADAGAVQALSLRLARAGVTSFCPTTMTLPPDWLERCVRAVAACLGREAGAAILGVHLEGPYLSYEKRGAQDPRYLRSASLPEAEALAAIAPIALISLAPETEGALAFARAAVGRFRLSIAHTTADYAAAKTALAAGFTHGTHLFCAMPPLHHRAPGAAAALLEDEHATAELICDGAHVHPAMLRLALRLLGEDRAVCVSDAVAPAGLPEGSHIINGQGFRCQGGAVYLEDGQTLAGGAGTLADGFRNLLRFGISVRAALKACTVNPARAVGADGSVGSLSPGKRADLLLLDEEWKLRRVMLRGTWLDQTT
ncbi:MAG: N-acetylglucosamine-6-phosphate deacetylase [Oscillospiraceae bacterium]|nr:N-acetylglucosamine-6-phosphate deacetylase [Oscillospiraceae bacterium]